MTLYVVGLDLSLTAPGVAGARGGTPVVDTIAIPARLRDIPRIDHICAQVLAWTLGADLVVMEGYAPGSQRAGLQSGVDERAGLRWIIKREIVHAGIPFVEISPSKLKKFATGKGNASKHEMTVAAVRRFVDVEFGDDNQVDATWLCAAGSQWLGNPLVSLPKAQVEVLEAGVIWPVAAGVAA